MFVHAEFRDCFSLNTKDKHITSVEQLITIMRSLAFSPTVVEAQKYFVENHKGSSLHTMYQITSTAASIVWPLFRTTWVSRHQKGKPFWILLE